MMIRIATEEDRDRWDAYVSEHSQGLAYQYWGWLEAVSKAYRFQGIRILAEQDGAVVGILSLVHMGLPLKKGTLISLPYCDIGGLLADSPEVERLLLAKGVIIADQSGIKRIDIRASESGIALEAGLVSHPGKVRMLLPLPESSEKLLAGFKAKLRSQINKPRKDGLTAVLGGMELLDGFYRVFSENMRDLGSPVHSKAWIKNVLSAYGRKARIGLVTMPDGTNAAAGIILLHPGTVSIPWASALRRFNRFNPNMLLYWEFLKFGSDEGYRSFDFGRSTPNEGTYRFKEQWGASPHPLWWYQIDVGRSRDGSLHFSNESASGGQSRLRRLGEGVIRRLPIPVAEVLGTATRKYISL